MQRADSLSARTSVSEGVTGALDVMVPGSFTTAWPCQADCSLYSENLGPGTMLTARYRLSRLLGTGGMGTVWAAEDLELRKVVAIKIAVPGCSLGSVVREAKLIAEARNPYTVELLELASTAEGRPFMVMELIGGDTLGARIQRSGVLSLRQTTRVVRGLCAALRYVHSRGIVHRDVKPDNIVVDHDLRLKLFDFGIAKSADEPPVSGVATTGVLLGTATHASPEQVLDSGRVDARADLWSLAVVAYQCLTGSVPYPGNTLAAVCLALRAGRFDPPSRVRADLPRALDAWFQRAFAPDIEGRYATVDELWQAWAEATSRERATERRQRPATRVACAAAVPA
jgi:serine/threonine protein kinase